MRIEDERKKVKIFRVAFVVVSIVWSEYGTWYDLFNCTIWLGGAHFNRAKQTHVTYDKEEGKHESIISPNAYSFTKRKRNEYENSTKSTCHLVII